jgi:hypothetical protein
MRTFRSTLVAALAIGLGGLIGCDTMPAMEEVHVTATLDVQVLNPNGTAPLPTLMTFTADKVENGNVIGTPFEFNAFTDLDGKVSFTVGYNLQKSGQWIELDVNCPVSGGGVTGARASIRYDDALAQSGGTGIAAITKPVVVQL